MINFFDKIYNSLDDRYIFLSKVKFYSFLRLIIRLSANILIPIYFRFYTKQEHSIHQHNQNQTGIIVSLTSFPARINRLWLVIESIFRQSYKPDRIILYLSKNQFPSEQSIPVKLLNQKKRGLTIELVDEDIKSYKKIVYTLNNYPQNYILTIDDDIFYRSNMIENLLNASVRNPKTVVAQYCRMMKWDIQNNLLSITKWNIIENETEPSNFIFFGSGGGTLFPPNSLNNSTSNAQLFTELCPTADDIWLNAMCRLNGFKVKKVNCPGAFLPIINFRNSTLSKINNVSQQNDIQINRLRAYYLKNFNIEVFQNK